MDIYNFISLLGIFLLIAFAHLFTKLMNVSGAESLYAASSIFAGIFSSTILSCSADTGEMALDSAG